MTKSQTYQGSSRLSIRTLISSTNFELLYFFFETALFRYNWYPGYWKYLKNKIWCSGIDNYIFVKTPVWWKL